MTKQMKKMQMGRRSRTRMRRWIRMRMMAKNLA
jgi:hypothetical protein